MLRITSIETFCNEFVGFVRITDAVSYTHLTLPTKA